MTFDRPFRLPQRSVCQPGSGAARHSAALLRLLPALFVAIMSAGCADDAGSASPAGSVSDLVAEPAELQVRADKEKPVEVSLRLRNRGSTPIEILEVTTRCGCMSAKPTWKPRIAPGESTEVCFGVQPMSYGHRKTSVSVRTSSRNQAEFTIPIEIKGPPLHPPYVRYAPDELNGRFDPDANAASLPFSIICVEKKDDPHWFLGCACTLKQVQFCAPELIEEIALDDTSVRREYRVVAAIGDVATPPRRLSGMVTLNVASASMRPLKTFPFRVTCEPVVSCTPAALLVRSPPCSRRVVVRSENEVPFQIQSATADVAWVSVEFDAEGESDTHVININVASEARSSELCHIVLATTHPRCATVTMDVVCESKSEQPGCCDLK